MPGQRCRASQPFRATPEADVQCSQTEDTAKQTSRSADYALTPAKVGKQFEAASKAGARFAIVVGPEEWPAGEVMLKNLATQAQEQVKITELVTRLTK